MNIVVEKPLHQLVIEHAQLRKALKRARDFIDAACDWPEADKVIDELDQALRETTPDPEGRTI
jgi:hypothetical protein